MLEPGKRRLAPSPLDKSHLALNTLRHIVRLRWDGRRLTVQASNRLYNVVFPVRMKMTRNRKKNKPTIKQREGARSGAAAQSLSSFFHGSERSDELFSFAAAMVANNLLMIRYIIIYIIKYFSVITARIGGISAKKKIL